MRRCKKKKHQTLKAWVPNPGRGKTFGRKGGLVGSMVNPQTVATRKNQLTYSNKGAGPGETFHMRKHLHWFKSLPKWVGTRTGKKVGGKGQKWSVNKESKAKSLKRGRKGRRSGLRGIVEM